VAISAGVIAMGMAAGRRIPWGLPPLPQAHFLVGLSTPILVFVVLGNGLPGMIFGWLYWRRGLMAAIVAHFGFDLVLKVIIPLFSGYRIAADPRRCLSRDHIP
jgi:membrane protease YdiL (CAAX protease family)